MTETLNVVSSCLSLVAGILSVVAVARTAGAPAPARTRRRNRRQP
jgi:hypothetical protein